MFDFIAEKLSQFWDFITSWKDIFIWCLKKYFIFSQELGNTIISAALEGLSGNVLGAPDISSVESKLAQINTFFPLSETLGFSVQLLALWVGVLSIKLILRFLPFGK